MYQSRIFGESKGRFFTWARASVSHAVAAIALGRLLQWKVVVWKDLQSIREAPLRPGASTVFLERLMPVFDFVVAVQSLQSVHLVPQDFDALADERVPRDRLEALKAFRAEVGSDLREQIRRSLIAQALAYQSQAADCSDVDLREDGFDEFRCKLDEGRGATGLFVICSRVSVSPIRCASSVMPCCPAMLTSLLW